MIIQYFKLENNNGHMKVEASLEDDKYKQELKR
jgi:hypothetical protein